MINEHLIKPRYTPEQRAQRDELLKAATFAQDWINRIIRYAKEDNWSEVEFYLNAGRHDHEEMKGLLPTDRAEPRAEPRGE
ncbi:TPA: hypothetical protein I8P16_000886 [Salmonella enterica subsp. enterica serovar Napoli]|nr:hypothetical protein [Salmonella enterica subsp. enterica serovar Napoli]HBC0336666.1 hypothetical protein [Salmonella enterica subsp. enterica serovar Napoli]